MRWILPASLASKGVYWRFILPYMWLLLIWLWNIPVAQYRWILGPRRYITYRVRRLGSSFTTFWLIVGVLAGILGTLGVSYVFPRTLVFSRAAFFQLAVLAVVVGSVLNVSVNLLLRSLGAQLVSILGLRYAPTFLEDVLSNEMQEDVVIFAGALSWMAQAPYQDAVSMLSPENRGTKRIRLLYRKRKNFRASQSKKLLQMEAALSKLRDDGLDCYEVPTLGAEMHACLTRNSFGIVIHPRRIATGSVSRQKDPYDDYIIPFRNKHLLKALWGFADGYIQPPSPER